MAPHPRVGELKQRRDSRIRGNLLSNGETPSPLGKLMETEQKHLRLSEEGEVANLWQTGQRERYTDGPYHGPTWLRLGCVFTGVEGGWELVCGDWRTGPERELQLAVGRRTGGWEGGNLQQGMPTEEDWTSMEAGTTAESHAAGRATIVASLSPHTSACQ